MLEPSQLPSGVCVIRKLGSRTEARPCTQALLCEIQRLALDFLCFKKFSGKSVIYSLKKYESRDTRKM